MELREAMAQISEIRSHIARTETFRGYRSVSVGFTGLMALTGAAVQSVWLPEPAEAVGTYLAFWVLVAVVSAAVPGAELAYRCFWSGSPWTRQLTRLAVQQFLPCVVVGGLLTAAMARFAVESLWLLPGLWSLIFSLGVFASCRLLPRPVFWIGVYYLLGGLVVLVWARGEAAFSPWAVAGTFGVGQLALAAILYFTLERKDDQG